MSKRADEELQRLLGLDAMRGIAAIAILLIHIGHLAGYPWLAPYGFLAVDLFFMLSGFVIGQAYETKLLTSMSWRRFLALRFARLYPVLFLGVMVGLLVGIAAPTGSYSIGWRSFGHFLLIPDLNGSTLYPINGVLWSLFFEIAINIAHVLTVKKLSTPRLALFTLATLVALSTAILAYGKGLGGLGMTPETFLPGFARVGWGYGMGLLLHRLLASGVVRVPATPFFAPLMGTLLIFLTPRIGVEQLRLFSSLFLLLPLLVAFSATTVAPVYVRRPAAWLGAISYPVYAVHFPLLQGFETLAGSAAGGDWALAALAILCFAAAVERFYETPCRRLLKRWVERGKRTAAIAKDQVEAELCFLQPGTIGAEIHALHPERTFLPTLEQRVRCHDMRFAPTPPRLDCEGFALLKHRSQVTDFGDPRQIEAVYLGELERLLREITGSPKVFILGKTILRSREHKRHFVAETVADRPARLVHCDCTERSVSHSLTAAMLRYGMDTPPPGRLVVYNLWRCISPPPQDLPLAICDKRTVEKGDLIPVQSLGNVGSVVFSTEIYSVSPNKRHRWCFFSNMACDELLVFQQHDAGDLEQASCPHAAFRDPNCPREANPRVSIEARAFAFFE